MNIKIGTCGWGYLPCKKYFGDNWKKSYESVLQCYAKLFRVVEINSKFYHIPKIETASDNLDLIKEICKDSNLIYCVVPFRVKF